MTSAVCDDLTVLVIITHYMCLTVYLRNVCCGWFVNFIIIFVLCELLFLFFVFNNYQTDFAFDIVYNIVPDSRCTAVLFWKFFHTTVVFAIYLRFVYDVIFVPEITQSRSTSVSGKTEGGGSYVKTEGTNRNMMAEINRWSVISPMSASWPDRVRCLRNIDFALNSRTVRVWGVPVEHCRVSENVNYSCPRVEYFHAFVSTQTIFFLFY